MRRKVLIGSALLAYLAVSAVFVVYFHGYLNKPTNEDWSAAHGFLRARGVYRGEPVLFTPGWLRNYATDFGRFKGMNLRTETDEPVYWQFSTGSAEREGYRGASTREFGRLKLHEMVREGHEVPPRSPRRPFGSGKRPPGHLEGR